MQILEYSMDIFKNGIIRFYVMQTSKTCCARVLSEWREFFGDAVFPNQRKEEFRQGKHPYACIFLFCRNGSNLFKATPGRSKCCFLFRYVISGLYITLPFSHRSKDHWRLHEAGLLRSCAGIQYRLLLLRRRHH